MNLTMDNLIKCFESAKDKGYTYIAVKVQTNGFPMSEIIINSKGNFDKKLEYYKNAYNDDLTLKTYNGVKIIGFTYGDDFDSIEYDLMK